jgi:thiosulfate/3-mercaptopyruvate sulfurtransferase
MRYVFADCRWALDDPDFGRRAYLAGHIPGAAFLDVERDLSAPSGRDGRHPLPSPEQFARAASRAGIDDDAFVVAYGSLGGAERLWWLLRHFGHRASAVIDLEAWRGPLQAGAEQIATTQCDTAQFDAAQFDPREEKGDTIEWPELAASRDGLVVVDARVEPRWRGEPNELDRVPGRIPGALSAPWNEPLPPLPEGEVVAYCGSGVTACVVLHRLSLAGRDGRLYPGSWSEWEQYPELPVERSS